MLKPSTERREITSRDRFSQKHRSTRGETFARSKNGSVPRRRVLYIFTAERGERNPLFHPRESTRAKFPRSRRRKTHFQIRTARHKNAFTHRATRKRERLHVVERDNQTSFLVCRSFFFSVGCAVFFFFCFGRRLLFPTRDRRGLIPFGIRTTKPLALHLKRRKKNAIVKVPSTR